MPWKRPPPASMPCWLGSTPAVLRIMQDGEPAFILLLAGKGRARQRAGARRTTQSAARRACCAMRCWPHMCGRCATRSAACCRFCRSTRRRAQASLDAIARARLGTKPIGGLWSIRLPDTAPFLTALRHHRVHWLALGLLAVFALSYLIEITGWRLMGETVLSGRMDFGWLLAWGLLLLSAIPVRYWGARRNAVTDGGGVGPHQATAAGGSARTSTRRSSAMPARGRSWRRCWRRRPSRRWR